MKAFVKIICVVAFVVCVGIAWFNLSLMGTVWIPDTDDVYIRYGENNIAFRFDKADNTLQCFEYTWIDKYGLWFEGRATEYNVEGYSPNKVLGVLYTEGNGAFNLRIAPVGYNVDIVTIECTSAYSTDNALEAVSVGESFKDKLYVNDTDMKIGGDHFVARTLDSLDVEDAYAIEYLSKKI